MSDQPEDTETLAVHPLRASDALISRSTYEADARRWQEMIAGGGLPEHVRTPQMAIALARAGEIFGWDPLRSLRSLFIVEGRVEMWAQDMLALIREKCPEATIQPIEVGPAKVTIRVQRPPQMTDPFDVTVTREQFGHARLKTRKGAPTPWALYPEDMLWARCVSRIGRRFFSDVTAGAYTVGELGESAVLRVRQVGPKEVSMPGESEEPAKDAEVITSDEEDQDAASDEIDYDDCDLCGGRDGEHTDALCPNLPVGEEASP